MQLTQETCASAHTVAVYESTSSRATVRSKEKGQAPRMSERPALSPMMLYLLRKLPCGLHNTLTELAASPAAPDRGSRVEGRVHLFLSPFR